MASFFTDGFRLNEVLNTNYLNISCDEDDEKEMNPHLSALAFAQSSAMNQQYYSSNSLLSSALISPISENLNQTQIVEGSQKTTHKGLMKTVIEDIKAFISEHRNIIYITLAVLLVDHFFLGGRLKERIRVMAEKLFGSVERKIDKITAPETPVIKS